MKLTDAGLRAFFSVLPLYEKLSLNQRGALARMDPGASSSFGPMGVQWELISAGFVQYSSATRHAAIMPDKREFLEVLRKLHAQPVFDAPTVPAFTAYLDEYLTTFEQKALLAGSPASDQFQRALFARITEPDWIQQFLAAKNADWEQPYVRTESPPMLASPGVFATAQALVRLASMRGAPVPLIELPTLWTAFDSLVSALRAAVRYGVLFLAVDHKTLKPVMGLWPPVGAYMARSVSHRPQPVQPAEICEPGFLMTDITALLIVCAAAPLRLKASDQTLFSKTRRDLADNLHSLPGWAERFIDVDSETRVGIAAGYAQAFGLTFTGGLASPQLTLTGRGRKWLALDPGRRLRVLVDGIQNRTQKISGFEDFEGLNLSSTGSQIQVVTKLKSKPDLDAALQTVLRLLDLDSFYPLAQLLALARDSANPLLATFRQDKRMRIWRNRAYFESLDPALLEQMWAWEIVNFVRGRLCPFGAVRLGAGPDGISIAITPVGRYFLGQSKSWEWSKSEDAQVIVQPNFEVTFLGLAAEAEAEIGRFAERKGRGIGALFQITKKSIYSAAAAGLNAKSVIEILERVCTRPTPGNVQREIEGWFAQCRTVKFESSLLIRCPDRETAARIVGLAKGSAVPLNDTVLEYQDPGKQRPALIKKLKDSGVLVEIHEIKTPQPARGIMRRRRRYSW